MRVDLIDPPAYSPPYDHCLARALAARGASVRLLTSRFAYGTVPQPDGYVRDACFYRHARGPAGSHRRRLTKLASHPYDMWRYRQAAEGADVVHFQWLTLPRLDLHLLPRRPTVLTIHDPLQRDRRSAAIGAAAFAGVDAIVVHSEYARRQVIAQHGLGPERVHVIRHGVLGTEPPSAAATLPPELPATELPVVLCFGLLRGYKGLEPLLAAWRGIEDAELWIVGRQMVDLTALKAAAPANVRFVPRFVSDAEAAALYARADVAVLPYERSERFGFSGVLARALGAGKAIVLSDLPGFSELAGDDPADPAVALVPPGQPAPLHDTLRALIDDPAARARLAQAARRAASEVYSWDVAARQTLELYARIGG